MANLVTRTSILLHLVTLFRFSTATAPYTPAAHECQRECMEGDPPRLCYYHLELEEYMTMSKACFNCPQNLTDCYRPHCIPADGIIRPIYTANKLLPGPSIQVCEGDLVVVDVKNMMGAEAVTLHWHGIHQRRSPFMDGVPYISQCEIPANTNFRYQFLADTPGTHYYHSHSGLQRADGLTGMIVVRQTAQNDEHFTLYDHDLPEHVVHVQDWSTGMAAAKFASHVHHSGNNKPESMLVNGRGIFNGDVDPTSKTARGKTPPEIFRVRKGFRYRFRFGSNGFLNCPIEISIQDHQLLMISTDGAPFQPLEVDSFVIYAGERFDLVLNASQSVGNYWIRFAGLLDCGENFSMIRQVAILRYEGADESEYPAGDTDYFSMRRDGNHGLQLNPFNSGTHDNLTTIAELNATIADDPRLMGEVDHRFYLSYDFNRLNNKRFNDEQHFSVDSVSSKHVVYTPQINHMSLMMPPAPLMSQWSDVPPSLFCNETTRSAKCLTEVCSCIYTLHVKLNSTVEVVLIDEGKVYDANHPFHLHGYAFRVVGVDRIARNVTLDQVKKLDAEGGIKRKLTRAVVKDTVTVPDGGYTVLRFVADNPGYWLFHCHISFHMDMGMAVVVKVGEHEDFHPVPRDYPRCGNYLPDIIGFNQGHNELYSRPREHRTDDPSTPKSRSTTHVSYTIIEPPGSSSPTVRLSTISLVCSLVVVAAIRL